MSYQILAYYHFTKVDSPFDEVASHKAFLTPRDCLARIYISEQGINGQMSASTQAADEYIAWMRRHPLFKETKFKLEPHQEHVFPKLTIKYRKELVAIDSDVDLAEGGLHVSPDEWKKRLESDEDYVLIDVRNDYEWKVGRFAKAELPPCESFRDFKTYAEELKNKIDPKKTPVLMYCTGGIRCEVYSAYLKAKGIENVLQLEGGIINYGQKEGSKHWLGKLFVFDDRLTAPISEEECAIIGRCHFCDTPNETYYNCANMDCNFLFLSCPTCLEKHLGSCCPSCTTAPRRRPYHQAEAHKPFRKGHNYFQK